MKKAAVIWVLFVLLILLLPFGSYAVESHQPKTPIKHVINIYLENHTFDNFFGIYPYSPYSSAQNITSALPTPVNLLGTSMMSNLSAIPAGTFSTPNPIEGETAYHTDWNHGKMNQFVKGSGPNSMTYYTPAQLGPLWDLAEQYSMADMYFAPVISESAPNSIYYLAGYSPVFNDYGPPPYIPFSHTIFGELSSYNVSWGVYIPHQSAGTSFSEFRHFSGMSQYSSNIYSWNSFTSQLKSGTLPSVSYVFAQGGNQTDQGAPSNLIEGEMWIMYLINSIEKSPIWNSTTVFITWDDPGGYYDQVAPPVVDGVQLGFRLPFMVISPYAKEGYISSTVLSHSSILAFIDYNWGLPALNQFVSSVNIPLDMFDFNTTYGSSTLARPPISFNFGSNFPLPQSPYFTLPTDLQSLNISGTYPMNPQFNLSSLPYEKTGSTAVNLSSLGSSVFNKTDSVIVPFYATPYFLFALIAVNVAVFSLAIGRRRRR